MRYITIIVVCGFLVCSTALAESELETRLAAMSQTLVASFSETSTIKIAVTDFVDLNGYQSALGKFVAEELTTQLAVIGAARVSVIERRHLMKVLAEQKLSATSLFDPESVEKIGQILGVQALITGSITDLGTEFKIHARVLSVESGRVIAAASTSIPNDETTKYLVRQVPGTPSDVLLAPRPGPATQPSGAFFENRFLRVTVDRVGINVDRNAVTVSLILASLADEDIQIALEGDGNWCRISLIDDTGGSLEAITGSGDNDISGLACISNPHYKADQAELYSLLTARSTTVVTLKFSGPKRNHFAETSDSQLKGHTAALSMDLLRLNGNKLNRFSIGITNIALGQ